MNFTIFGFILKHKDKQLWKLFLFTGVLKLLVVLFTIENFKTVTNASSIFSTGIKLIFFNA